MNDVDNDFNFVVNDANINASEDNENKDDEKSAIYKSPPGIDNPNNDMLITDAPTDTVTSLYFSPQKNSSDFVVTTWDKQVRHYRSINDDSSSAINSVILMGTQYHEKPVLDSCWNGNDSTKIYTVGCDRIIKVWDLEKNVFSTMDFKPTPATTSMDLLDVNIDEKDDGSECKNDSNITVPEAELAKLLIAQLQVKFDNAHNISADIKDEISSKIDEWHPKIAEKLTARMLKQCNETQCKSYLNDLISFRIKVDNLALEIIEADIKNAAAKQKAIQQQTVAAKVEEKTMKYVHHAAPIRCVKYISENNVIITGSWDKKVKYWDTRASICCGSLDLGHKIYCMASLTPILTVGLSNKHVQVYDLRNPSQVIINKTTPLKHQLRCMDIFPSKDGFGVGSIEGRVAIEMIDNKEAKKKNFSFKCHRHSADKDVTAETDNKEDEQNVSTSQVNQTNVYGVNSISFHPNGTFITGGSDGEINYWDRIQRSRLKHTKRMQLPIVATAFNCNASLLAYATSYDWSQGAQGFDEKNHKPQIYVHVVEQTDVDRNNFRSDL